MKFIPYRAFFEPLALEYRLGRELYDRLQEMKVMVRMTGSHNRVTGIPGATAEEGYREAKRTLVVGVKKSLDFATCRPSAHYQLPLTTGCPGQCEYCYLNTTLGKKPYLRVYVNIDEILDRARQYIEGHQPRITVFEGAATSDPVATEYLTGLLFKTVEFFGRQPLGRFRFVTKHTDIDSLLTANHNGHTRFRFSLNAASAIKRYEHAAPSLEERIEAAGRVAGAGYPVGFIIAPIFHFPGWEKEYEGLLKNLQRTLPTGSATALTFELITHRFTRRAKNNIAHIFPASELPLDETERHFKFGQFGYGKYIYHSSVMNELREKLSNRINEYFPAAQIEYFV